jgi:hypothetical protein
MEGSGSLNIIADPDPYKIIPEPYKIIADPDPGGPKTYGSGTLAKTT